MSNVSLLPDAEATIVAYLRSRLANQSPAVHVGVAVPKARPSHLVRVNRAGGVVRDMVTDQAMLTVECWAPTRPESAVLAQQVRAWLWELPGRGFGGVWCDRAQEISGPMNFPDPETDLPRYQMTIQFDLTGEPL